MSDEGPGGSSLEYFKSVSLEVGDWIWGTAQGAFNEKATLSQIIVDAVIGMIPFVGDVTGVRDLIAVVIGLSTDPRKREEKMQWVLLVVLLLALIPVIGGIIKGVGRLLIKVMGEVAHLAAGAQRAAKLAEAAKDIVAFLNRVGVGNAEKFLRELKFADHQRALLTKLDELIDVITKVLESGKARVGSWVPQRFVDAIDGVTRGLRWLKDAAPQRLKEAIKELDDFLRELQTYVRTGGETTSRTAAHAAEAGAKDVHRTEELLLLDGNAAKVSPRGGLVANSNKPADVAQYYKHEPGFPDLTSYAPPADDGLTVTFPNIATYSGKILNQQLKAGDQVFRVFGKGGDAVYGVVLKEANKPAGKFLKAPGFWGMKVPPNAKSWRENYAVLDEWNHNGFICIGTVLDGHTLPACIGRVAEQTGREIAAQYLPGGGPQAMLQLAEDVGIELNRLGEQVMNGGAPIVKELGGIRWELRPTHWENPTGVYGYRAVPGPGSVRTARLATKTIASKEED